jgi:prepilin-type N-terminal cleavage/methylation domain-containing protein
MKRHLSSLVGFTILRLRSGFTIIELLVVISVIAILAAITLVSYSGVSSRATIATMQSDLSSASTALRLDQATTDSFPATLALANNGKGISPSQSMDSIIYIPDNTSNPKNFCLQYKKGSNTYAVDATTQPSKGVCLQNLVTNGDFGNGTVGWTPSATTLFALNNECYFTAAAQYAGPIQFIANYSNYKSHILYYSVFAKVDSSSVYFVLNDGLGQGIVNTTTFGSYARLSGVWTVNPNATNMYTKLQDSRSSAWTTNYVKYWSVFDLTAAFGAGNEPTKATMDTIMSGYANSWFNITAKANL